MTDTITAKDVAGLALYLEFRKTDYTYQVIITQPFVGRENNKPHRSRIMRRRMNSYQTRKNWHFSTATGSNARVLPDTTGRLRFTQLDQNDAKVFAAESMGGTITLFNQLFHQEYTLMKPLMVEMTYEDVETLLQNKTPNNLVRRIQRTRVAQGFGEEIVPTTATTPTV